MSDATAQKKGRAASPKPTADVPRKMSDEDRAIVIDRLKSKRLVIGEAGLKRIAEHKYVPGVYTPMDNAMNKYFWTPLSEYIPKSLAPNMITVTGLVFQIVGFSVLAYYCPDFEAVAPRWAYIVAAFTIFAYQTFDALDGKQARRTGSSSPLGQLFDHGCDSVVTIFISMLCAMCLRLGFCVRGIWFEMSFLLPFWMCQWTEYHAHVLPTSVGGLFGVTEAQFFSVALVLINVVDSDFWIRDLGIGHMPNWWCGKESCPIAGNDVVVCTQTLTMLVGVVECMRTVYVAVRGKGSMLQAASQALPVWMLTCVGYAWCIQIPHAHPRLVVFTLGVSFSHLTCKMIVAAMSHIEYPVFQPILLPLPIIFLIIKMEWLPRHTEVLLGAYTALSVYSMGKWVQSAIEEISQYLGIRAFRLGPREKPEKAKDN